MRGYEHFVNDFEALWAYETYCPFLVSRRYVVSESIVLTPAHSGAEPGKEVTFASASAPGEPRAVVSGGVKIDGVTWDSLPRGNS